MLAYAIAGFLAACLVSAILTMLVRGIAPRLGLTDRPDSHRKLHGRPIPLGGGIAVFLATVTVLGAAVVVPNPWNLGIEQDYREIVSFLVAMGGVVLLGVVDDRVVVRGRHKLFGQVVAASILMAGGLVIRKVGLFGWDIELGLLSIPVTLFWLVGATNAVNLLDGSDGLATTLGIIVSLAIAVMAALTGHPAVAFVALVFTGSLVGFLRFNFPPATIFLGDAGSMLIGLMAGAMAIRASLKGPGTVLLAAPMAMLAIPILDSTVAILRRKLTGRSIYTTDRGHLHHQLLARFGSNHTVLACVAVCCVLTSATGLLSAALKSDLIALISCLALVVVFITTGLFGRGEFLLLAGRLRNLGLSLVRPIGPNRAGVHETAVQLQGSRRWNDLWAMLVHSAEELKLDKVQLDLNHPAAQEGFNASWERQSLEELDRYWSLEYPLIVEGRPVGRLRLVGQGNREPLCERLGDLLNVVQPFEKEFQTLLKKDVAKGQCVRRDGAKGERVIALRETVALAKRQA
jgi:UDP-GlcNAc:undecaprenyl-phosphate GlcNAc-1-phosphate transferase